MPDSGKSGPAPTETGFPSVTEKGYMEEVKCDCVGAIPEASDDRWCYLQVRYMLFFKEKEVKIR